MSHQNVSSLIGKKKIDFEFGIVVFWIGYWRFWIGECGNRTMGKTPIPNSESPVDNVITIC